MRTLKALSDAGLGLGRELVVDISAFDGYESHEITPVWTR